MPGEEPRTPLLQKSAGSDGAERQKGRNRGSRGPEGLTLLGLDADAAASESRDARLAAGGMREESLRQRPFMCSRRFFSTSFLSSLHPPPLLCVFPTPAAIAPPELPPLLCLRLFIPTVIRRTLSSSLLTETGRAASYDLPGRKQTPGNRRRWI